MGLPPEHERRSATLKLEAIGDAYEARSRELMAAMNNALPGSGERIPSRRPWVAWITGADGRFGLCRTFLQGKKDYSEGNSIGSRGVYYYFHLFAGHIYEVSHWRGWRNHERCFCRVESGQIIRMSREEVDQWLNNS